MFCSRCILSVLFGDGSVDEENTFREHDILTFNRMVITRRTCTRSAMNVPELDWKQWFIPASPWKLMLKIDGHDEYHVWLWIYLCNLDFVTGKSISHRSYTPALMMTTIQLAGLIGGQSILYHTIHHWWNCREHIVCWQEKWSTCSNTEQENCCLRRHSDPQILILPKTSKLRVVPLLACLPPSKTRVPHMKIESK
jgi:hypothetical protein